MVFSLFLRGSYSDCDLINMFLYCHRHKRVLWTIFDLLANNRFVLMLKPSLKSTWEKRKDRKTIIKWEEKWLTWGTVGQTDNGRSFQISIVSIAASSSFHSPRTPSYFGVPNNVKLRSVKLAQLHVMASPAELSFQRINSFHLISSLLRVCKMERLDRRGVKWIITPFCIWPKQLFSLQGCKKECILTVYAVL